MPSAKKVLGKAGPVAPGDNFDEAVRALREMCGLSNLLSDLAAAIGALPPTVLARWFASENPVVRAVMFCVVPPSRRSPLLSLLSENDRTALVVMTGKGLEATEDALRTVLDEALARAEAAQSLNRGRGETLGGRDTLRTLLSGIAPSFAHELLEGVETADAALAADMRAGLVTVERLAELFLPDRARVLMAVPEKSLVLFLYGVRASKRSGSDSLYASFLAAFSSSRRTALEEDLACLERVARKDVDAATAAVIAAARTLKGAGRIAFPWEDEWVS